MYSIDEVLRAATIISTSLPTLASEELQHHLEELRSAFDSLNGVFRSATPPANTSSLNTRNQDETSDVPQDETPQNHNFRNDHRDIEIIRCDDIARRNPPQESRREDLAQERSMPKEIPPKSRKTPSQDTYLNAIMNILGKFKDEILSFVNKDAETAVLYLENWTDMDPFEVDIQLSLRGSSTAQRFRTFLARYIFAEKYLDWAVSKYQKPRDSFLRLDARAAASKQISYVSEYLEAIERPDKRNKRSVEHGLKLHSFAHIYAHSGAFAFLFYVHTQFRELKCESLEMLVWRIKLSSIWSTLATEKKGWFSDCVSLYKMDCGMFFDLTYSILLVNSKMNSCVSEGTSPKTSY